MPDVISSNRLAVDGGTPVRDSKEKPWPSWPHNTETEWENEIEPALREVYLGRTEGLPASMSDRFGKAFAAYCGAGYGLMMPHGTDAISASLAGALDLDGLGEGGEIIIPNYTFIATASAALSVRCRLALADIDPVSFTLDPNAVEAAITGRTVGLLPVHMGGHPADMDALNAIAERTRPGGCRRCRAGPRLGAQGKEGGPAGPCRRLQLPIQQEPDGRGGRLSCHQPSVHLRTGLRIQGRWTTPRRRTMGIPAPRMELPHLRVPRIHPFGAAQAIAASDRGSMSKRGLSHTGTDRRRRRHPAGDASRGQHVTGIIST